MYSFFSSLNINSFYNLQAHIKTFEGRIAETILNLRFFIFQYGIVYKLHVQGSNTSLSVSSLNELFSLFFYLTFTNIVRKFSKYPSYIV